MTLEGVKLEDKHGERSDDSPEYGAG